MSVMDPSSGSPTAGRRSATVGEAAGAKASETHNHHNLIILFHGVFFAVKVIFSNQPNDVIGVMMM